ncbi:hydantoinase B/oxoprolinase family protein [Pseudonocardia sp. ICBG1122]|nr:hydantoinase B/oxoprolinase family protein [Pseudonocardia pini]
MTDVQTEAPTGARPTDRRDRIDVDPVTFEVIRHRMYAILDEQAAALSAVSGSPLVNEATDFNTGIYGADGAVAAMGQTVIFHAASVSQMVRFVIADCEDDPGIDDGDVFIVNSPYKGALHAPDMGVLTPVFHEGRRIAWTGAACHLLDVGGMSHGGFASKAVDVRQESMIVPPTKLVERGTMRTDVWNMVTGMSRLPVNVGLDLKGLLAAVGVAKRRLGELIERYGVDTVLSVMDELMDTSERRFRERLRTLPDGRFSARTYLEHDGHTNSVHRIEVTLTKTDDRLVFDYSNSSPQARGFVNCTYTGLLAGVYSGLLPTIGYDVPWTEGVFRCVEVVAPEGLICSARFPAPVSQGPLGSTWLAELAAIEVVSKLLSTRDDLMSEAQAAPSGGPDVFNVDGLNQHGEPASGVMLDQTMTGGPAYPQHDGLSPAGHHTMIAGKAPNVESLELIMPFLYLYRRMLTDTPGAGRSRGGQSSGAAYVLHDVDRVELSCACHGYTVPTAVGIFGGLPAACNVHRVYRDTDVRARLASGRTIAGLDELSELGGTEEPLSAKPEPFGFGPDDVYECGPSGGGGWGDPLLRDPEDVAADVRLGAVSRHTAERAHGVVVDDAGDVDAIATAALRDRITATRRDRPAAVELSSPFTGTGRRLHPVGDQLTISEFDGQAAWTCRCGTAFAPADENPKLYLGVAPLAADDLGTRIALHEEIEVRSYACRSCGVQHFVEIAHHDDGPLFDVRVGASGSEG